MGFRFGVSVGVSIGGGGGGRSGGGGATNLVAGMEGERRRFTVRKVRAVRGRVRISVGGGSICWFW